LPVVLWGGLDPLKRWYAARGKTSGFKRNAIISLPAAAGTRAIGLYLEQSLGSIIIRNRVQGVKYY
jgi:hypothetical protein